MQHFQNPARFDHNVFGQLVSIVIFLIQTLLGTEIVTSLPLQVMLYFNWQFSIVFFIGEVIAFVWKVFVLLKTV